MRRFITDRLISWKNSPARKPLIIRGARQVGKTYTVLDFAERNFAGKVHYFNFEKNPEYGTVFEGNLDTDRIVAELELISGNRIKKGEELLFFDEIQECHKAIASLRYFYEDNADIPVIAAGSLLEFAMNDISFPVGRIQLLEMYPMTFAEYLMAIGKDVVASRVTDEDASFSSSVIEAVNEELLKYFRVGGMPECVKSFVETGSYIEVANVQTDLIATFRQDFSKYAGRSDKRCLNDVLTSVARKTGEKIKYTQLADGYTNPTIKKAFELLEMARLFTRIRYATPSGFPLSLHASDKYFKTVFLDVGLFSNINGVNTRNILQKKEMSSLWNGKIAEQFVGQELVAHHNNDVFYWGGEKRGSSAEVDYLIVNNGEVAPVEVKSGKSGKMKSLHLLLRQYPNLQKAFVLSETNLGKIEEQKLRFLPLFCAVRL